MNKPLISIIASAIFTFISTSAIAESQTITPNKNFSSKVQIGNSIYTLSPEKLELIDKWKYQIDFGINIDVEEFKGLDEADIPT